MFPIKAPVWDNASVLLGSSPAMWWQHSGSAGRLSIVATCYTFSDWLLRSELSWQRLVCSWYFGSFALGVNWSWVGDGCVYFFLSLMEWKQRVHNVKVEFHIVSLRLWTLQVLIQCRLRVSMLCLNKINCGCCTGPALSPFQSLFLLQGTNLTYCIYACMTSS